MNKFFDRMAQDLETYAAHAKRKTIDVEDAILLLRRYTCRNAFSSIILSELSEFIVVFTLKCHPDA